jgi:ribonuclease-3
MRSALARQSSFAKLALALDLDEYVRMGKGEVASGGRRRVSTLCDVFEALVGAVYLAGGLPPVVDLVMPLLKKEFEDPAALLDDLNPKGMLQEYTQKYCKAERPEYIVAHKKGPDHDCEYEIEVAVKGKVIGTGVGKSRKSAEMIAASNALKALKNVFEGKEK